ncbi:YheC/YheD family protein [Paenibacillus thiaminolyticus]|uniref:YheC/YheD family endospore coat-associated protein n=1 Tax=Paenibacillus thiaminolyticus TaxID=49283 RepID=UPI0023310C62|nr:YheC/YheD family protein [Paenibacillus thiaminolyticus]WCF09651.1 YheC/YheD family protein [Paenibacillus thiaminolyticus]
MADNRIGILFNSNMLRGLLRNKTGHEAIAFYEEAGRLHGVIPCFMREEDVNVKQMEAVAYIKDGTGYARRRIPVPTVIHNRAIYFHSGAHARIRSMVNRGTVIFNQVNRYGKWKLHVLLQQDSELVPHLPITTLARPGNVAALMDGYGAIVLKPDNNSVGHGIMKLERSSTGWTIVYSWRTSGGSRRWRKAKLPGGKLPRFVLAQLRRTPYLVQELLPLARYHDRPFDLRVSVQRDGSREWQITGIVGRVAPQHTFVTNVAQGGTVHQLEELVAAGVPHCSVLEVVERVNAFSLHIVNRLSHSLPHMADVGLDIGLTSDGKPLFIECNGRDQRYSFREAGLYDIWKATYSNPIAYGASFLQS